MPFMSTHRERQRIDSCEWDSSQITHHQYYHTGNILKEILIPTTTTSSHVRYRHVRMTANTTIIVPQLAEEQSSRIHS